jgi:predicted ATPase/DNA-binding SARP family transcriptional activator
MEFRILGPLEVRTDGRAVPIAGPKPRAVLAMLLLHADQPVSAERLAAALWGEDAPAAAVKTVQVHVSRLRKALGDPDVLTTTPAGYRLKVRPEQIDAACLERDVAAGRQELAAGRADQAARLLRAALALWRGAPLAEFAWAPFAPAEVNRLEELHVAAVELRVEADLAAGRAAELIAELQQLTCRHPWRERLHALLMLALYRSGRQADALEAYRHARDVLVEQLGIEPGDELHELNQAILVHDPALQPPSATVASAVDRRSTLPAAPNRTIGRGREVGRIGERLRAGSARLLTLTGPGGVGKTRLALEAARFVEADFENGAQFVALDSVQRPQDVPAAIVTTLEIVLLSGESADEAVERFLAGRHLLLVLDNCEHVLGAATFIGGLLASCPGVTLLTTSREPLSLQAEERLPVPPLALPHAGSEEDATALAGVDAVALFCERARTHDPEFELSEGNATAVASICRRLDGLPLAIELAAARCGLLSAAEIANRLDTALGALGAGARDAPARQQTLWATIDWSHELLSDDEKACFARVAVFAGGATVDAAEAITGASLETLDRLVAKSLLVRRRQADPPTRLGMLETVRAYALERFEAMPDHDAIHERHYRHFVALAQRHGTDRALWGTGRREHLARLDADIDNLHAALAWAVVRANAEPALTLAAALGSYWLIRDRYADAVEWIDQVVSLPGADAHPVLRVRALCIKSLGLWPLGRVAERPAVMAEAEAVAKALAEPLILSQVLQTRAIHEASEGRFERAEPLADEALRWASVAEDEWAIAMAAFSSAMAARSAAELRERVDRAASLLEGVGNVYQLAFVFAAAAYGALCYGSDHDASHFVRRAIPITRELDNPYLWMLLRGNVGLAALLTGDTDAAAEAFRDELALCRELVAVPFASEGLYGLAAVAAVRDDVDRAARLAGAAAAHRYGYAEDAVDARLRANFFEPARKRSPDDAWDAAVREGGALSFKDAIAYSLDEPRSPSPNPASNQSAPVYPSP